MHPRRFAYLCLFLLFFLPLFAVVPLIAQEGSARISGLVTDSAKAALAEVNVVAVNVDTGVRFTGKTNSSGVFVLPGLPVGGYRIEVDRTGFKSIIEPNVMLHVQDALQLNFEMALGSTSETVTVSGDSVNINTTDATVSTVIDRQFAENLPMNGRTFQSLIYLTPGVQLNSGSGINPGWAMGQFTVNGQRATSNYWMIDGVSANIGIAPGATPGNGAAGGLGAVNAVGGTSGLVSVDALQEFRVQTATYAPEFGRVPGGQISIASRSGTNAFHGTVFDYLRNGDMDATD